MSLKIITNLIYNDFLMIIKILKHRIPHGPPFYQRIFHLLQKRLKKKKKTVAKNSTVAIDVCKIVLMCSLFVPLYNSTRCFSLVSLVSFSYE